MKLSIITVTLNNKAGLLRAIESVRSQTYKNVEHIIVDGGSTDGTKEAINNLQFTIYNLQLTMNNEQFTINNGKVDWSSRMESSDLKDQERFLTHSGIRNDKALNSDNYSLVFLSEKDNGIYDAINKGIKLAKGDVIGLLHSDDFYADKLVLERYADTFQDKRGKNKDKSFEGIEAVYSDLVYVKEKSNVKGQKSKVGDNEDTYNYLHNADYSVIRMWKTQEGEFTTEAQRHREILKGWMPPHPTLFLRREVFVKYGLYRTDMKIAADYEMILRLFFKNKITSHYIPITTYCMTIGGASNKSLKNIIRKSSEDFYAMKLHGIPSPIKALLLKNFRKLPQFINKSK